MNVQEVFRDISQRIIGLSEGKKPPYPANTDMDWGGLDEQPLEQVHNNHFNPRKKIEDLLDTRAAGLVMVIGSLAAGYTVTFKLEEALGLSYHPVLQLMVSMLTLASR